MYYSWSTMCQEVITYSPTTMIVTKPPAYNQEFCINVAFDCDSLSVAMSSCNSAYRTAPADLSNCLCNDNLLYLASRCDIDANESCLRRTLESTALYTNKFCRNTTQTIASHLSPASVSPRPLLGPGSTYVPPTPTPTTNSQATATSVLTGNGMARQELSKGSTRVAFAFVIAAFVV